MKRHILLAGILIGVILSGIWACTSMLGPQSSTGDANPVVATQSEITEAGTPKPLDEQMALRIVKGSEAFNNIESLIVNASAPVVAMLSDTLVAVCFDFRPQEYQESILTILPAMIYVCLLYTSPSPRD